jgi:hypothetical protein
MYAATGNRLIKCHIAILVGPGLCQCLAIVAHVTNKKRTKKNQYDVDILGRLQVFAVLMVCF